MVEITIIFFAGFNFGGILYGLAGAGLYANSIRMGRRGVLLWRFGLILNFV